MLVTLVGRVLYLVLIEFLFQMIVWRFLLDCCKMTVLAPKWGLFHSFVLFFTRLTFPDYEIVVSDVDRVALDTVNAFSKLFVLVFVCVPWACALVLYHVVGSLLLWRVLLRGIIWTVLVGVYEFWSDVCRLLQNLDSWSINYDLNRYFLLLGDQAQPYATQSIRFASKLFVGLLVEPLYLLLLILYVFLRFVYKSCVAPACAACWKCLDSASTWLCAATRAFCEDVGLTVRNIGSWGVFFYVNHLMELVIVVDDAGEPGIVERLFFVSEKRYSAAERSCVSSLFVVLVFGAPYVLWKLFAGAIVNAGFAILKIGVTLWYFAYLSVGFKVNEILCLTVKAGAKINETLDFFYILETDRNRLADELERRLRSNSCVMQVVLVVVRVVFVFIYFAWRLLVIRTLSVLSRIIINLFRQDAHVDNLYLSVRFYIPEHLDLSAARETANFLRDLRTARALWRWLVCWQYSAYHFPRVLTAREGRISTRSSTLSDLVRTYRFFGAMQTMDESGCSEAEITEFHVRANR